MRKALFATLLLLFVAAWIGCGDSTHSMVPTSNLAFVRASSGTAAMHLLVQKDGIHSHVFDAKPFSTGIAPGNESVVMMKNDGTGETALSIQNTSTGNFGAVQLSLDGEMGVGTAVDENGYLQIYVANMANPKNLKVVQLTTDAENHHVPQLSPDNKTVLFFKYDYTSGNYQAYTIKASGGAETLISTPSVDVVTPTYTPDGKKIVFEEEGNDTIDIMNADGSDIKVLTNGQGTYYDELPSVSADGKTIAFSRWGNNEGGGEDIYKVSIDGTNLRQLTTTGNAWDPLFVNNKIAYVSAGDIYSMNVDGTSQKNLTNTPSQYESFLGWED
jgi:Tol biopolymer transport system component